MNRLLSTSSCILATLLFFSCTNKKQQEAFHGAISAASPEASLAGYEILRKGGNAADAAIAASFVLGVTEIPMSGLGGGMQLLVSIPGKEPIAINGATVSPLATPTDAISKDLTYHRRSTIPSTVKVLDYLHRNYGSGNLSWEDLIEPAIKYAKDGFEVGPFRAKVYKRYETRLYESPHNVQYILKPDGQIPLEGDRLLQPVLANTLERLARIGADDFYKGQIAREIAADMSTNIGWISLEDLSSFPDPVELKPLKTSFRGYEVYSQPPPCGGWTVLLALNMLETYPPDQLAPGSESRFSKILTALHLAHRDRKANPITDLVNYQEQVDLKISKEYARELLEEDGGEASAEVETESGETTHFSVVDKEGMAIAATASINAYFGARATTEGLGFLYNTYMDDFELESPGHPFAIQPQAMNYSSMSPTIVRKEVREAQE